MQKDYKNGKLEEFLIKNLSNNNSFLSKIVLKVGSETEKDEILTSLENPANKLPNRLTLSRALGPIVIPLSTLIPGGIATLATMGGFAITDFLDGKVARKRGTSNRGGALLDAAVDKFFAVGLIIVAMPIAPILAINGLLEVKIASINSQNVKEKNNVQSTMIGKIKTALLSVAIGTAYLSITGLPVLGITPEILQTITLALGVSTSVFETINIIQYKQGNKLTNKVIHDNVAQNELEKQMVQEKSKNKVNTFTKEEELQQLKKLREELTEEPIIKEKSYTMKKRQ